eukprot:6210224-Pleurochrysis_carterae.AAC.1
MDSMLNSWLVEEGFQISGGNRYNTCTNLRYCRKPPPPPPPTRKSAHTPLLTRRQCSSRKVPHSHRSLESQQNVAYTHKARECVRGRKSLAELGCTHDGRSCGAESEEVREGMGAPLTLATP